MRAITAKYVFDGVNLLTDKVVLIDDGLIIDLIDRDRLFDPKLLEDFGNVIISAGFIDLQLNGCGGVLLNDDISFATLEQMHQTNLRFGTSSFLPTLITSSFADIEKTLELIKEWFAKYTNTRGVIGLHLEGPFISVAKKGIHEEEFIIQPTMEILNKIVSYVKYFPIKVTLAPEQVTLEHIRFLTKHGVVVSLGHTNASYEQANDAILNGGASNVTHLFNAMSGFTGRNPGVIAAALANDVYMGMIADLLHVDAASINLIAKLKPTNAYLVTDAVTPTGTNMIEFKFAGKQLYVRNGRCVDDMDTLGGAYLTMNQAVANCVDKCAISFEQALMMATLTPAKVLKLDNQMGKIAQGYMANLITINNDFECQII